MAKLIWLLVGVVLGAVAGQRFSRTAQGERMLAAVSGTAGEFVQTVADSYRARRAETGNG
jgi:uncharacterized membrane protein YeaQ/YmgE (transglycosylase-associated protein family)